MTDQQTTAPQGDAGDVARETVHQWGIEYRFKMSADDRERVIASIANLLTQREQAARVEEREAACAAMCEGCRIKAPMSAPPGWQPSDDRCEQCDNGVQPDWTYCPYCGAQGRAVKP
jgi:hypothetical protein